MICDTYYNSILSNKDLTLKLWHIVTATVGSCVNKPVYFKKYPEFTNYGTAADCEFSVKVCELCFETGGRIAARGLYNAAFNDFKAPSEQGGFIGIPTFVIPLQTVEEIPHLKSLTTFPIELNINKNIDVDSLKGDYSGKLREFVCYFDHRWLERMLDSYLPFGTIIINIKWADDNGDGLNPYFVPCEPYITSNLPAAKQDLFSPEIVHTPFAVTDKLKRTIMATAKEKGKLLTIKDIVLMCVSIRTCKYLQMLTTMMQDFNMSGKGNVFTIDVNANIY